MVSLPVVHASNALLPTTLPAGLVGVFVGATSGIGETTLLEYAKHTSGLKPRVYIVGRNEAAATRIIAQCKVLNPSGEFVFLRSDVSLIKQVDDVCNEIKKRESVINLLFISAGSPDLDRTLTPEGLPKFTALLIYARIRFITLLLPLIRIAPSLRRIVIVGGGTYEGALYPEDIPAIQVPLIFLRGHLYSVITLAIEGLAKDAPEVSFVNDFPGAVDTPFLSHIRGILGVMLRTYFRLFGWLICVPIQECGERHLYFLTSARYPAKKHEGAYDGVALGEAKDLEISKGSDGQEGSGVYSVDWDGESASPKVWKLLAGYRKEEMVERITMHADDEFKRIFGEVS